MLGGRNPANSSDFWIRRISLNFQDLLADLAVQAGGLVEIYVLETTVEDWRRVAGMLREPTFAATMTHAGTSTEVCVLDDMFTEGERLEYRLELRIGEQVWTTGFYGPDAIDFQGDPRDITSAGALEAVVDFMRALHDVTGKRVILVPETLRPHEVRPYVQVV